MRRFLPSWLPGLVAALVTFVCACGSDHSGATAPLAVLSAFPGELAATVARAEITGTLTIDGLDDRLFRVGTLNGVPVILGMTGIGVANAARTTRAVLDNTAVAGVVFSGVAGSPYRIGDVVVAESWALDDASRYPADASWLAHARALERDGVEGFVSCVDVAPDVAPSPVCLAYEPSLRVGGTGHSSGFAEAPLACRDDGDPVFGCDIAPPDTTSAALSDAARAAAVASPAEGFTVEDMESAAVAREAAASGLPFIAFRGTSDGAGDPLGLPGFPAQFFFYYPLAAANAAHAVEEFLGTLR